MIFTAFVDTAEYLFEHVSAFARRELGLQTAVVTGTKPGRSTINEEIGRASCRERV